MLFISKILFFVFVFIIMFLLVIFPDISSGAVTNGILISSNILIPSLFPFMICVLMIVKNKNIIEDIFGRKFYIYFVFFMSLIGGYPLGAKLISELCDQKIIDNKTANTMLLFCVNSGPAFVVSVVGKTLGNKRIGVILLTSHILSSVIIFITCLKYIKFQTKSNVIKNKLKTSEIFIESTFDAASSMLSISCFVIVFSVINSYFDYFFQNMPIIKNVSLFMEITYAVNNCKNIFILSFLLGFSGLSIWFQIFAISKKININIYKFIIGRVVHGTISMIITYVLIKILNLKITTFCNNVTFERKYVFSNITLSISLLIMTLVLFIYLFSKNNSRKIYDDVI